MSQSFIAVSDDIYIKNQIYALKLWKHIKCDSEKKQMKNNLYTKGYVNDDNITLMCFHKTVNVIKCETLHPYPLLLIIQVQCSLI